MRNKIRLFSIPLLLLLLPIFLNLTSCEGTLENNTDGPVIGTWILSEEHTDSLTVLFRSDQLDPHQYGFTFHPNGIFTERKNAGWCGTPPITYDNFEGRWWKISDNVYHIDVDYWGGRTNYRIEIISQNSFQLQIKYHYSN